jgi:hypothetical protein
MDPTQLSHRSWISLDWHLAGLLTHASANLNSLPEKFSVAGAMLRVQFSAITVTG